MWFDLLMDDCKKTLLVSDKYHGVFFPVFLKLFMTLIMGIFFVGSAVALIASGAMTGFENMEGFEIAMSILKSLGLVGVIAYILYLILWALIEVGSINMISAAFNDQKPSKSVFLQGIKTYLGKVISGELLIHFVLIILSPVLLIGLILYVVIIGIPTAGYGVIFLSVAVGAYFATWTIAIVEDEMSVTEGLGASFTLARNHFKPLFVIVLSTSMLSQYVSWLFGPLGAVFAGWFLAGIVNIYFKMVTYRTYMRYTDERAL